MADKKISQLTSASTPLAGTEVLPIVQSGSTVKVASDDLTVKNVRSNATTGILQVVGPGAGTTRVMTTPNANFTTARTDAAQTFTGDQTFQADGYFGTANSGLTQLSLTTTGEAANQKNWRFQTGTGIGAGVLRLRAINDAGSSGQNAWVVSRTADNIDSQSFLTGGSNRLSIGATDVTVNTGNLVVGTAGKGIDFSANSHAAGMSSELLNWYETGTWTPIYVPETGSFTSISYGFNTGQYVRIGGLVWVSWSMRTSALTVGTASGTVSIGGLPFAILNATGGPQNALGTGDAFGVNNAAVVAAVANTSTLLLYQERNNTTIQVTDLSTGGANNFTSGMICYRAA